MSNLTKCLLRTWPVLDPEVCYEYIHTSILAAPVKMQPCDERGRIFS